MNWLVYKGEIAQKENESLSKVLRQKLNITSDELATLDSEREMRNLRQEEKHKQDATQSGQVNQ